MKPIDPLQLQRLVDGELDELQVQQILGDAETAPDRWQDIAIGYIENQLWCKTFRSAETSELDAPDLAMPLSDDSDPTLHSDSDPHRAAIAPSTSRNDRRPFNFSWLIMAASLLVAATIGYMTSQITNRTIPAPMIADHDTQQPGADLSSGPMIAQKSRPENTQQPQITQASLKPDYHLEVPMDSGHFKDLETSGSATSVPLYQIGNRDQLNQLNEKRNAPVLPREVLSRLASSGYQMEQSVEFISGQLENGQSFMVPVRTIRFVPGQ